MPSIRTVTGTIAPEALGFCQPHEHIFVRPTPASRENAALRIDDEARSAEELIAYRAAGGDALIDCQPVGAGRDIRALRRLSAASGVSIVAVTGYHLPAFYPRDHWILTEDADRLRERFLAELGAGVASGAVGQGPVFPGAVKAAIGRDGPAGRFEVCLRAAAGAAARADVPLILHTEYGAGAVEAVSICEQEGLDPARVAVCHVDRQAEDFAPHEAVARTGARLEYDTVGRWKYHDDASEAALILHMLDLGHADRLLISLDTTSARLASYGGAPGLTYILRAFLALLREAGVPEDAIRAMTRDNPRRLFE